MLIIPVIDLSHGQVVHAVRGNRDRYQPINSKLCQGHEPVNIVAAILELHPFQTLYIADIDAILGAGNNTDTIGKIHKHFPNLQLWLDQGLSNPHDLQNYTLTQLTHVIGSETGINNIDLCSIKDFQKSFVLSLDFDNKKLIGDHLIMTSTDTWPERIIIMTLARVGSETGPDIECINKIKALAPCHKLYVAGGIRHCNDLNLVKETGVAGALIATAFHTGGISGEQLNCFLE